MPIKYYKQRTMGQPLQALKCYCFYRGTLKSFQTGTILSEKFIYTTYSFVVSLIITLLFNCTLYLIQKIMTKTAQEKQKLT